MRNFLFALCCLCFGIVTITDAQTVSIDPLPQNIYCMGQTVTVTYTTTGNFVKGNAFILQLSSPDGSFQKGFVNLASVTGTGSGSIAATLPHTKKEGTTYRLRVIGSNPVAMGPDNGVDLTIGYPSQAGFSVDRNVILVGETVKVVNTSRENSLHTWTFGDGAVPPTSDAVSPGTVTYTTPGSKTVSLTVQSRYGCPSTVTRTLEVVSLNPTLPSIMKIAQTDSVTNEREPLEAVWVCPGGAFTARHGWTSHAYVETGGHCDLSRSSAKSTIVWAKTGSSVSLPNYENVLVIHEPGVSLLNDTSGSSRVIEVPSITFDYTKAPAGGCPSLAPYVKKLPDNVLTIVKELTNDESDREFWVKDGGRLTADGAENVYAVESGGKVTAQGDNCVIYLKNGATFDAQGSGGHRIFYETEATIINPGAEAALFPSSGVTIVPESVSSVPGVVSGAGSIVLRPNPAESVVDIDIPAELGMVRRISLYNMLGARVHEAQSGTLNVSGLPAGLYQIRVETDSGTYQESLLVQ